MTSANGSRSGEPGKPRALAGFLRRPDSATRLQSNHREQCRRGQRRQRPSFSRRRTAGSSGADMLPGIRALTIAIIAALGLLIGAFALAAALRVAQESRSGQLRADLAQRGRALVA